MIKDPIIINVDKDVDTISEKYLHKQVILMLEQRFLQLGVGFALIGHEYKIRIDNKLYRIDLLFFNYKLNAFVVIEVKVREMHPKDIGQIEFYTKYINENIKEKYHKNTIGMLIVAKKNKLIVKYVTNKDIYVTTYKLVAK